VDEIETGSDAETDGEGEYGSLQQDACRDPYNLSEECQEDGPSPYFFGRRFRSEGSLIAAQVFDAHVKTERTLHWREDQYGQQHHWISTRTRRKFKVRYWALSKDDCFTCLVEKKYGD
jgi:hypothetical protein